MWSRAQQKLVFILRAAIFCTVGIFSNDVIHTCQSTLSFHGKKVSFKVSGLASIAQQEKIILRKLYKNTRLIEVLHMTQSELRSIVKEA